MADGLIHLRGVVCRNEWIYYFKIQSGSIILFQNPIQIRNFM